MTGKEFGKLVRKHRIRREMTQVDVQKATRGGIERTVLCRLEAGRIKQPTLKTMNLLAFAYGLTVSDLLRDPDG